MSALTIEELKKRADTAKLNSLALRQNGMHVFNLSPPMPIRCLRGRFGHHNPGGEMVHTDQCCDGMGKYSDTVYVIENGFWWDIDCFELP